MYPTFFKTGLISIILLCTFAVRSFSADLQIVTTIKPVNALVMGLTTGLNPPHLIIKGAGSPHLYSLRPSDAKALEAARLVFWIGEGMETFLETSLSKLAKNAVIVELGDAPGLVRHKYREGGNWAAHAHDEHKHDDDHANSRKHDDDDHDEAHHDDDKHDHEKHADEKHGHEEHAHGEHDNGIDMHLWLDPGNAKAMIDRIKSALIKAYPQHRAVFEENAARFAKKLSALDKDIRAVLAPVKSRPYVVFHDAFQYFEKHFGLNGVGAITLSPDRQPGAERIKEIQARIKQMNVSCIFAEPQFQPRQIASVIEGTSAKTAILDPLGANLADGPELYFKLMRQNAKALRGCLSPTG